MVRDHNGTYVIRLTELTRHSIEGVQLRDDGTDYPEQFQETLAWPIRDPHVQIDVDGLDVYRGDIVTVYVEFGTYTVVAVEHFTLHPRRLHERLLRIEKHLGLS